MRLIRFWHTPKLSPLELKPKPSVFVRIVFAFEAMTIPVHLLRPSVTLADKIFTIVVVLLLVDAAVPRRKGEGLRLVPVVLSALGVIAAVTVFFLRDNWVSTAPVYGFIVTLAFPVYLFPWAWRRSATGVPPAFRYGRAEDLARQQPGSD